MLVHIIIQVHILAKITREPLEGMHHQPVKIVRKFGGDHDSVPINEEDDHKGVSHSKDLNTEAKKQFLTKPKK